MRPFFASTELGSPGGSGSGRGAGRIELRQDRLEAPHARQQREAVARDRFAEQLGQDRFVGIVEFRHHVSMRRKRGDGDIAPLTLGKALTAQCD